MPILGRFFPGQPRQAGSLLLTVREAKTTTEKLFVVADLPDAQEWASQINSRQNTLSKVHANRDDLAGQQEQAQAGWKEAETALTEAQRALRSVEDEVGRLRGQQNKLRKQQAEIERAREAATNQAPAQAKKGGKR